MQNLCNFCHNLRAFMWRRIEPKSTFVEKKWQISGLDGIHQRQKQVHPDHPPLFLEEGNEEVHLPLQPQLLGGVRRLPALAHQGGQGVRRTSLPNPPPSVIYVLPRVGLSTCPLSMASAAGCFNHLSRCLLSRRPCLFSSINMTSLLSTPHKTLDQYNRKV